MNTKKDYLSKTIMVNTEDALKNAVEVGYGLSIFKEIMRIKLQEK